MPKKLLDDDSDSEIELKTDNEYAKKYNDWRKKEELNKLKTRYGEELLDEESSSSSEDDDESVDENMKGEFLRVLSWLKSKDPKKYDQDVKFFENTEEKAPSKKKKKEKPMFIHDYERELILKKNGEVSGSEEEEEDPRSKSPTYVEEQEQIKENLKKALNAVDGEDDDDDEDDDKWGGMLKVREKSEKEKAKEEAEYIQWLAGQKEELKDKKMEDELKPLKDYWNDPNLDEGEKFLRDYILHDKYTEKEDENYIPAYNEIVHDSDVDLSEDERTIEQHEEFEHKFNFRFEEPDPEFIKRYPRHIEHSLRKTDDKRKIKRAETKERKQKEKEQKKEDLKKLQELKKKEIEEKIQKLREITGNDDIDLKDDDLEGDFDPEAHDRKMQSLFNDDFYQGPEGDQKPEFPDLDEYLEIENWQKWQGGDEEGNAGGEEEYAPHCEDDDFNMDCDYDPTTDFKKELIENSKGKKKRKRKSLFAKAVSQPKPAFDPNDKTYEEYLDEYYKFDCEDIIGDIPCRFKYRKVAPNSFGLSIEEILTANDRELNKWCSLKKAIQHRPDHVEKFEQIAYEKKGKNLDLKKKILPSLFVEEKTQEEKQQEDNTHKKKRKKVRCKKGVGINQESEGNENMEGKNEGETNVAVTKEKEKKKLKEETSMDAEAMENGDLISGKRKKKKHKENGDNTVIDVKEQGENHITNTGEGKKKKKKKRKNNESNLEKEGSKIENNEVSETPKVTENGQSTNKKKKKKQKAKAKNNNSTENNVGKKRKLDNTNSEVPKKKLKKDFKEKKQELGISDARLSAYGINPKKFKNKLKYKKA